MNRQLPDPQRLLIVRNDRLGDLIMTLPTLRFARTTWPSAEITALVSRRTSALLEGNRDVDRVLVDTAECSAWQLSRQLRSHRFDAALVICSNTRNQLATWLAGIPRRVTWGTRLAGLLLGNRRVWLRRSHPPIHESRFSLAFAQRLLRPDDPRLDRRPPHVTWTPDPAVAARVDAWITANLEGSGPLFGVHPGNYGSSLNWPLESYAQLVARLARRGRVLITGGPGEEELLQSLRSQCPSELQSRIAWNGTFDLMELAAAISWMQVLVVSNTGPMHLAGLIGTPLVALFSRVACESPEKWAPLGDQRVLLQPPLSAPPENGQAGSEAMRQITVEQAVRAVEAMLQTGKPANGLRSDMTAERKSA